MAEHWYFCVDCKTPGCHERQVLRYIGANPDGAEISLPVPFLTRCSLCRQVHDYRLREDVRPRDLGVPPPPDFENKV